MTALLNAWDAGQRWWRSTADARATPAGRTVVWAAEAAAFLAVVFVGFDLPVGSLLGGVAVGALYGLIGVAIILVYRTHRIINFAAAGLGAVPGVALALLVALHGFPWALAFPLSIVLGALLGGLTDLLIIRRFSRSPRLILTVATLGVGQLFAFMGFYVGLWLGTEGEAAPTMRTPFSKYDIHIGQSHYNFNYPFALAVVAVAVVALALFLRYSRIGIAMRASAENADRASLLGIPVKLVQTGSWVLAGGLASTIIFLRSQLIGIPSDGSLGPKVFVFALAAAVLARMDQIPQCLVAGVGVGILTDAVTLKTGKDSLTAAIMLVVILLALLAQRTTLSRAQDTGASSWQAVPEFRPIPLEMRGLFEVRLLRSVLALVSAAFFIALPFWAGERRIGYVQLILISAIIAVSLVILTGWAGQISLGQYALVAVGSVVIGKLVGDHNVDFFASLVLAMVAGAAVSVLIGLPALRIQGMYLAVTTMLFAAAVQYFALDPSYRFSQIILPQPTHRIEAPLLWGRIRLTDSFGTTSSRPFYWVCLAALAVSLLMARAYRKNRAGRAILAVRENSRAAASYSVNSAWTRLGAFAVSGAIAALAGALLAYASGKIDADTYSIERSIEIFIITVVGGLTSLPGAVFGAILLQSIDQFGGERAALLATGPGLLLVLMFLPGGFAQAFYQARDRVLRRWAVKHDLLVPSLVADRRVEEKLTDTDETLIEQAEHHVEEVDAFDVVSEPVVHCPVCGVDLPLDAAPEHEHLRAPALSAQGQEAGE